MFHSLASFNYLNTGRFVLLMEPDVIPFIRQGLHLF